MSPAIKDDHYWEKRRKNNEAAKRSREKRRQNDMVVETRLAELAKENNKLKIELDSILKTTPATDTLLPNVQHSGRPTTPSTGDAMPTTMNTLHHPQALMPSAQFGGLSAMMAHSPGVMNAQQQPQLNNMAPLLQQLYSQAQFAINQMNNVNRLGLLSTCLSAAVTPAQQHSMVHDRRQSPSLTNQQLTPPALCAVDLASNSSRGSTYSAPAQPPAYTAATSRSCDLRVLANAPLLGSLLQNQQQQQPSPSLLSSASAVHQQQQALKNCLSSFAVHLDQNGRVVKMNLFNSNIRYIFQPPHRNRQMVNRRIHRRTIRTRVSRV